MYKVYIYVCMYINMYILNTFSYYELPVYLFFPIFNSIH